MAKAEQQVASELNQYRAAKLLKYCLEHGDEISTVLELALILQNIRKDERERVGGYVEMIPWIRV